MKMLKVRDKPNMYRDAHSKAILINDEQARINYRNHKAVATQSQTSTEELKREVELLKSNVDEIKQLLYQIVKKDNN